MGFVFLNAILCIYLWLHWILIAVCGLSLAVASAFHSPAGIRRLLTVVASPVWSPGSRGAGSVDVVHGLSCPAAHGIFLDKRWNLCRLHWQVDS